MNREILSTTLNELMVEIPGGEIDLRDDRTKQKWTVNIEPFLLAKFAITQDIYFHITNKAPSLFKGDKRPVETVTWQEAVIFCNLLSEKSGLKSCYILGEQEVEISFDPTANGFRLPTEAEWEYACKAGAKEIRYDKLDLIAWYKDNSQQSTHNVGQKKPNAWGLYDMLGNVWEWCSDLYDTEIYGSYRIFRGGGWCDEERSVMATTRRRSHPLKFKIDDMGFRIAKNVD
ncbi:formylglycine-generating enzyme family protein [Chryseobacterium sp. A321]